MKSFIRKHIILFIGLFSINMIVQSSDTISFTKSEDVLKFLLGDWYWQYSKGCYVTGCYLSSPHCNGYTERLHFDSINNQKDSMSYVLFRADTIIKERNRLIITYDTLDGGWILELVDNNPLNRFYHQLFVVANKDSTMSLGELCSDCPNNSYSRKKVIPDASKCDVKIKETSISKLELYPNPALNMIHIKTANRIMRYDIYQLDGKLLDSKRLNNNEISVDLSKFKSGTHLLKVWTKDTVFYSKFLKQ